MRPPRIYDRDRSGRIKVAAYKLRMAMRANQQIAPLREFLDPQDIEGAYAVQLVNTRRAVAAGRRIVGYKIGLTSRSLQQRFGISEPDFGILFDDMRIPTNGKLPKAAVLQPRVEGEIALVVKKDIVSSSISADEIDDSFAAALPAIEVVGSRIADWSITAADTIADNGSAGAFIIGGDAHSLPLSSLSAAQMTLRIDGEVVGEGIGSAAFGGPLESFAWLARTAANRGYPLRAGDVILTGSLAPMTPLPHGAFVQVEVEGLGGACFRSES